MIPTHLCRFVGGDSEHLLGWEAFQALCDVVYKPGMFVGKYPKLSSIARLAPHGQWRLQILWSSSEASYTGDDSGNPGILGN